MANPKLDALYDSKYEMEAAIRRVNDETKTIKYMNTPQDIYLAVTRIAEDRGIDVDDYSDLEYNIKQVREAVNELESAIYQLVEPFEDALRDINNDIDEEEIEEEYANCL